RTLSWPAAIHAHDARSPGTGRLHRRRSPTAVCRTRAKVSRMEPQGDCSETDRPGPPWDYEGRARELLARATRALDIGTGAGELFAGLCNGYRGRAVASEPWNVNAPIAKRRLSPLGIEVVHCASLHLPFQDGVFDLVIDRHEEMDPDEVHRVLEPGGLVLTQQVGRNEWTELR